MSRNRFPPDHFYHLAITSNLPSILKHGLLSTEQLLLLTDLSTDEMECLLRTHRKESLVLCDGTITIRDQSPMPPKALSKVLPEEISPSDWYQFLNTFVFLWSSKERVERHLHACGDIPQSLLVLDARKLLENLGDLIYLSPINSGFALRKASFRSPDSVVSYKEWKNSGWPMIDGKKRPSSDLPVEILVKGKVDLEPYLIRIE